jgi:surfeit locus 1 family protein
MKKNWVFIFLVCIPGLLLLLLLGAWQLQRLAWKEGLLRDISSSLNSVPAKLPLKPETSVHNYFMTFTSGKIQSESVHVLTSKKQAGPGFKVISPLILADGRSILIDRGFIIEKDKNQKFEIREFNEIVGYLLWPNETDHFTPEPNLERNIWFARDLNKMADFLETERILLVATSINQDKSFQISAPDITIPNNHLQYAITWFLMAILWFGMSIYFFMGNKFKEAS